MLLAFVKARGGTVIDVLLAAALAYLAYRLLQRRRERRRFADAASAAASQARLGRWPRVTPPKVLDARPPASADGPLCPLPGVLTLDPHSPEQIDGALLAYDMVIYCICPDSATAVEITQRMRRNGYTRIRALRGGLDAWQRRGFPVEPLAPADEFSTGNRAPESRGETHGETRGEARGAITLRGFAPRSTQGT